MTTGRWFLLLLGALTWALASILMVGSPGSAAHAADKDPARVPMDPASRAKRLELPARDAVAKPEEVVAALRLLPGQVVGDIGAGTGYYARRFARAVGPGGRVYAVDIEPYMIGELKRLAEAEGITNIVPILARKDDSHLPEASCDLVFLCSVYNSLPDRPAYLRHLITRLRPGGRIAIIGTPKGVPDGGDPSRRLPTAQVLDELQAAGFVVQETLDFVHSRYFVIAALPK